MNQLAVPPMTYAQGLRYGALGLPLAFVALPLYVLLPSHYASNFGVPLAALGVVLLLARLLDAFVDPLLGRMVDASFGRSASRVLKMALAGAAALGCGFVALFFPPVFARATVNGLLLWAFASLAVTYLGYSLVSVAHQAWGARLGGSDLQRARIVAWREGFGLLGVVLASVLPVVIGLPASTGVFIVSLCAGWWLWSLATQPTGATQGEPLPAPPLMLPFKSSAFRRLLTVFLLNGIASSIPATLLLFFIKDQLRGPAGVEGPLLAAYFLCAAASIPAWLWLVGRIGLARTWLCAMVLAVVVFAGTFTLGAGDIAAFALVCALSGVALGADLAVPSALLAGVIQRSGDGGQAEGIYFGWWNFATKLNLALAAGLCLPVLGLAGYAPGVRDPQALQALTLAYCVLPCLLKAIAALALYTLVIHPRSFFFIPKGTP